MSRLFELRKKATTLVTQETLGQAMQEASQIAKGLDRNSQEHANLERIYNEINAILKKTPQEMQQDGAQTLEDYFDDAKMPQFANKLKGAVEQIRNYRTQQVAPSTMGAHASKEAAGMDAKLKLEARDALAGIADSVGYSPKQGVLIAKRGYFYTHGMDERKFADGIVRALNKVGLKVNIVATSNHWNAWPKDSWFECRFTVEPSPVANKPMEPAIPEGTPAPLQAEPTPEPSGWDKLNSPENPSSVAAPATSAPIEASAEKQAAPPTGYEDADGFGGDLIKYERQDLIDIANAKMGWAIAGQLEGILDGEPFEDQNSNALKYIAEFAHEKGEEELAQSIEAYLEHGNVHATASKKADVSFAPKQVGTRPAPEAAGPSQISPVSQASPAAKPVSTTPAAPVKNHTPSQKKEHTPDRVSVTSSQKKAMALNYEQVLTPLGFEQDENAQSVEDEQVYWNPQHEVGGKGSIEAIVVMGDGTWEAYGGGGANDIIGEGHGPEQLQEWLNKKSKRGAVVAKKADAVEPEIEAVGDELPIEEEMPVEEGAGAMPAAPEMGAGMGGLDPQSLGTKALGAAIKALAGVPEFMDDKSAVLWIEQLSSVLKNRPVEQKAAKHHGQPAKCDCGSKAMAGSDMCGACEKEYAMKNEKAASSKVAVAPPGREDQVKALKKEDVDNPYAVAWSSYNKSHEGASKAAAWLGVRRRLVSAGVENADGVAWLIKADGVEPSRAAYLVSKDASAYVSKFASAGAGGAGAWTSNEVTSDVDKGESEGSSRVQEVAQAHALRDDNTGIKRPATTLPEKFAAEMTPAKALKACESAEEDLKKLYLDLKTIASVNNVAAVRNAVEAVYSASTLFDDAKKAFNKMMMAEEAEEKAEDAAKKKEASALDISSPLFALNIAAAE